MVQDASTTPAADPPARTAAVAANAFAAAFGFWALTQGLDGASGSPAAALSGALVGAAGAFGVIGALWAGDRPLRAAVGIVWAAAAACLIVGGGVAQPLALAWFAAPALAVVAAGGHRAEVLDAALIGFLAAIVALAMRLAAGLDVGEQPLLLAQGPISASVAAGAALAGLGLAALWQPAAAEDNPALRRAEARIAALQQERAEAQTALDAAAAAQAALRTERDERAAAAAALEQDLAAAHARAEDQALYFAQASHELRTPLNAIIGFADAMRQGLFGPIPERYRDYAGLIHGSGEDMLRLVNGALDIAKADADRYDLHLEQFDARVAIGSAMRLLQDQADRAGVRLVGDCPDQPMRIHADPDALNQILVNLLSNAIKFTPAGGAITIRGASDDTGCRISVRDTGAGMTAEQVSALGQPYRSSPALAGRQRGTGIGFTLVRKLVALHGASLSVESAPGEGTEITLGFAAGPAASSLAAE